MATLKDLYERVVTALDSWSAAQRSLAGAKPGRRGFYLRLREAGQKTEELLHAHGEWTEAKGEAKPAEPKRPRRTPADPAEPAGSEAGPGASPAAAEVAPAVPVLPERLPEPPRDRGFLRR